MEQILSFAEGKRLLLIIDNCDHLVGEVADFCERFVDHPGESRLLTTSREPLDVEGEQVVSVRPLGTDEGDDAAVQLVTTRAAEVEGEFVLTADNVGTVRHLCERLDGFPLVIELAAARCRVMTPEEMLADVEDRFRLLNGGRRRQRRRT